MESRTFICLHVWEIVFLIFFVNFMIVLSNEEFYSILGVSRTANNDEIRRAYRGLAREWHPDKNTDSGAQEKFIKINEAYETLSDPKKREDYDRYGHSGAPNQWKKDNQFQDSGFMFFNGMPFQFQSNWRHRDFTTLNYFQRTILPESHKKPYLLQIVSDWCINCAAVEEIWENASRELKSLGLGTGRVNKNMDPQLAKQLGAGKLPDFVGVISGKLYHYSGTVTVGKLKEFVSELFPNNFVPEVTNSTLNSFLHRWYDNKPRALLFTSKTKPPLLLKIVSFKYRDNVGIGYVQLDNPSNVAMGERFGAEKFGPTFAIFKENAFQPDVLVKGSELKSGALDEVISKNLYLNFPRLSSQSMFEIFCPQERFLSQRSLCVLLFINNNPHHLLEHPLLRMSKDPTWLAKKVRFAYVNQGHQQPFESSIKMNEKTRTTCKDNKTSKKVVILWHVKKTEVKYSWLAAGWCGHKDVSRLTAMLNQLHSGRAKLDTSAVVAELNDEHAKGFLSRLFDVWNDIVYYSFHYFNWSANLSTLSLVITFVVVFFLSYLLPSGSEEDCNLKPNQDHQTPGTSDVFGLIQLNSETQEEFLHKAKQSKLFIVLLSDATSNSQAVRSPIVQMFADISRLHLRENLFTFGWLSLQDHIAWCNEVTKVQTFGETKPGTVLALHGPKKYLSIFKVQRRSESEQNAGGNFFEDFAEEDGEVASMVFQEDKRTERRVAEALGRELPRWLEKLYEGMLPRVKLEQWPRMESDN